MPSATKLTISLIVILVVAIIATAAYTSFMANNNTQPTPDNDNNSDTEPTTDNQTCGDDTSNEAPYASFYVSPRTPIINQPVMFMDSSTIASGEITDYLWTFGDGQNTISANPSHVYSTTGEKTVTLTITASNDQTSTATRKINIVETSGMSVSFAEFTMSSTSPYVSQSILFTDTSMQGAGRIAQWYWDFGDGQTSTSQNPTHSYQTAGEKTVTLAVVDTGFLTSSISHTFTVREPTEPTARFQFTPQQTTIGQTIAFECTTHPGSAIVNQFSWDFGDGQTSADHHPTHTYTTDGEKTVTFTVTDVFGLTSTFTQTIYISPEQ